MFSGWVERWPQEWDMNGLYSQTTPTIVDSFAPLSQTILKAPFFMDILGTSPRFFLPLNEPAGSNHSIDIGPNQLGYAQMVNSPYGAISPTYGQSINSTAGSLTGGINGYGGPVLQFNNTTSGVGTQQSGAYLDLGTIGVSGPVSGATGWTRMIAFNAGTAPPANTGCLWGWDQFTFEVSSYTGTGLFIIGASGATPGELQLVYGTNSAINLATNICDGNWHLLFFSLDSTGTQYGGVMDGVIGGLGLTSSANLTNIGSDILGGVLFRGQNWFYQGSVAQVATIAEWPVGIHSNPNWYNQLNSISGGWRNGYNGESSDARYKRILAWAGYKGQTSIGAGASAMGPVTDLIPTTALGGNLVTSGTDALTALNNVVITENGNHFVDKAGVLTFQPRATRYQPFIPAATFGENVAAGEIPYEDLSFDFDTTQVANDVQITQNYTQQLYLAEGSTGNPINPGSQAQFGVRTLQRTVNNTVAQECIDAANFYLYRYGQSDLRVAKITVHVSALFHSVPTVWATCLGLELGSMVVVNRRPPGWASNPAAQIISWNGFVESISWDMSPSTATLTMELSPADRYQFWEWAQAHGTLKNSATSGATSIVINPLADSATNPASCSFYNGMSLCLDAGLATQETVTVTSVGTTTAGYTSATINVSALTQNHAANAVWEDATSGISGVSTNPGYFDAYAVVGSTTRWAY